jgi:hypothetical protein
MIAAIYARKSTDQSGCAKAPPLTRAPVRTTTPIGITRGRFIAVSSRLGTLSSGFVIIEGTVDVRKHGHPGPRSAWHHDAPVPGSPLGA